MTDDTELLRRYAVDRSESDFAELVRRHVNLVHSAALRQVNGDAHLAQDVTQLVFTDLARKAAALAQHRVLAGWLFTSTRFAAAKLVRGEQRRRTREQEAQLMHEISQSDPAAQLDWGRIRPVLDEALGELDERDREAILLRLFEGRDIAGVGEKLALSENTARMRVDRAVDKLHALLARRGVTSPSAALAAALGSHAVAAAPAGLAASVTGAALSGAGAAAGAAAGGGLIATFMSMTKLQVGITSALALAGATGFVLQAESNSALRSEVASLRQENAAIAPLQAENAKLARTTAEVADMHKDDAALAKLGDEAVALKLQLQQRAQVEAVRAAAASADFAVYDPSKLDRQPQPKMQARPEYPFDLRRAGIRGEAVVDFVVDPNGNVLNAHAVKSAVSGGNLGKNDAAKTAPFTVAGDTTATINGQPVAEAGKLFEAAAVDAVSQWKFTPGLKGGQNVGTHMLVPIVFTLNKD